MFLMIHTEFFHTDYLFHADYFFTRILKILKMATLFATR